MEIDIRQVGGEIRRGELKMKKIIILSMLGAMAFSAQAALYFYDGFNYAPNTQLKSNSSNLWLNATSTCVNSNRAGSLTYSSMLPTGTGGQISQWGNLSNYGMVKRGYTNAVSGDVFASFLVKVASMSANVWGGIGSTVSILTLRGESSAAGYGQIVITNNIAGDNTAFKVGLKQSIGNSTAQTIVWDNNGGSGYALNQTLMIVVGYTNGGGTNWYASAWINPASTNMGAAALTKVQGAATNTSQYVLMGPGDVSAAGSTIYFDELRVGNTWSDVALAAPKNIETSTSALDISEGATNSFQIRLNSLPDASVTVNVSRVSGSTNLAVLPASASAIFNPADWNVYQSIHIEALADSDSTNDTATITCADAGGIYFPANVSAVQIDTTVSPPSAGFSAMTTVGYAPLLVTFIDTSTGTITNRFWDFGDGGTTNTTTNVVSHTYNVVATNTVQLIVSGPLGVSTNTQSNLINIIIPSLYFYDGFDYTPDTELRNDSLNYWVNGINTCLVSNRAGNLTYTGLPSLPASTGGQVALYGTLSAYGNVRRTFVPPGNFADMFASFLLNVDTLGSAVFGGVSSASCIFNLKNGSNTSGGYGEVVVTNFTAGSTALFKIGMKQYGVAAVAWDDNGGIGYAADQTHMIVVSYTNTVGTTNWTSQLWIDPASTNMGAANLTQVQGYYNTMGVNYVSIGCGDANGGSSIYVDELRVGPTWATVVDAPVPTFALTVNSGTGDGSYTNTQVVVIAADAPAPGKHFVAWIGDTQYVASVTASNTTVAMPAHNISLTATYADPISYYILTVNSGNGGGSYTNGQQVLIEADIPASGYAFDKWIGDTQYVAGVTASTTTVTMPTQAVSVTATYITTGQYTANGTPHSWLDRYGLTNHIADDVLDQDMDGLQAWQEYIAGTDPTNAVSCLTVAQTARNVASWNAVSGRVYSVHWSTNLAQGFTALNTNVLYPQNSYTNEAPDSRVNLYQVKVRME